jgi:hypothetical protein
LIAHGLAMVAEHGQFSAQSLELGRLSRAV